MDKNYISKMKSIYEMEGFEALIQNLSNYAEQNVLSQYDVEELAKNFFKITAGGGDYFGASVGFLFKKLYDKFPNSQKIKKYLDDIYIELDNNGIVYTDIPKDKVKSVEIKRTQSCDINIIKEKMLHIVDMTIEDLYNQYGKINFSKIEFNTICSELSGVISETFYFDDKNNKKTIEDVREWPDERQWAIMNNIKQDMYKQQPKEGAWLESQMIIFPNKTYKINFIYDEYEKLSKISKKPDNIQEEFRKYPRSKDFTPEWWKNILGKKVKYV